MFFDLGYAGQYHFGWYYVQHLVYEDGYDVNRVGFCLLDEDNNWVDQEVVQKFELYNPNGQKVNLTKMQVWHYAAHWDNWYQSDIGQWHYDENSFFNTVDYFKYIEDTLIKGTYRLKVTDINGEVITADYDFNGLVKLPFIKPETIEARVINGNFVCRWQPVSMVFPNYKDADLETHLSFIIRTTENGRFSSWFETWCPTHLNQIFIPNNIVQKIVKQGDEFFLILQLETNDKNNRFRTQIPLVKALQ
jgi:hypothetical protein